MTRTEFLQQLEQELQKRGVSDAGEIVEEYREHFAFKLADGYSQEEIAAKLGSPLTVAAQYEPGEAVRATGGRRFTGLLGLGLAEAAEFFVFLMLLAFGLTMTAADIAFAAAGVCLVAHFPVAGLLPNMPYGPACVLGLALVALSVLTYTGCVWYGAYLRQSLRAFARFRANVLAGMDGRPTLPPVPARPQMDPVRFRRLRRVARGAVMVFAVLFVAGMAVSMLTAGAVEFWHAWGWFGYGA